jgi:succinate dehydrogenase / fumarate reductase membrane anchor subunit
MASNPGNKSLMAPLGRARGLGSAKQGAGHWRTQRVTGIALVPLSLWFVWSVTHLAGAEQDEVKHWLSRPVSAILMSLLVVAMFYHLALGLQVVIEDYMHRESVKIMTLLLVKGLIVLAAASALFAVLRVALGG